MLTDRQVPMHTFWAVMNGAGRFGKIKAKPSLALIMALKALDQEESNMSWPAGTRACFWMGNRGIMLFHADVKSWLSMLRAFVMFCVKPLCQCVTGKVVVCDFLSALCHFWSAANECICAFVCVRRCKNTAHESGRSRFRTEPHVCEMRRSAVLQWKRPETRRWSPHGQLKRQRKVKQGCHKNYQRNVF